MLWTPTASDLEILRQFVQEYNEQLGPQHCRASPIRPQNLYFMKSLQSRDHITCKTKRLQLSLEDPATYRVKGLAHFQVEGVCWPTSKSSLRCRFKDGSEISEKPSPCHKVMQGVRDVASSLIMVSQWGWWWCDFDGFGLYLIEICQNFRYHDWSALMIHFNNQLIGVVCFSLIPRCVNRRTAVAAVMR